MGKPSVVLLHGVGLDHTVWQPVGGLLRDRFEIIALDLPGHGANPPVPAGATLADLADGVAGRIPGGSHLVGFSLGALIAQHLALRRPELVASLTLVSSVCQRTVRERDAVLSRLDVAAADFKASTEASLVRWFDGTDVDADFVRRTKATLLANDVESFLNCYRVFATADAQIGTELGSIAVPTVAVTGEEDPGSTPDMTHRLAAAIPGCVPIVVPGARHMLPLQSPDAVVDCILTATGGIAHV
ncbi:alpha/beta fold hydrolase [Nocardioides zeae]|uniref:Pimeloyl-ACP methyl ester carboxylesterase n=1 Tax=Nocardioides zeae TaxID=1457234 RepID=A0AAJ1U6J8_9ACTN|nr:alpha/beta fold hydrolase [Nocardioides zeae]MDQ1105446.1 pimeloyl-ACP methyl ester carboxylesterase [Nocardioides zeae]